MSHSQKPNRDTFSSKFRLITTMTGVAVGLGNVWRFPYMAGMFGGASFIIIYLAIVLLIGYPALMAEWYLGRYTGTGTLGAFKKSGFPGGKQLGFLLFIIVFFATAYYANTVGWVLFFGLGEACRIIGLAFNSAAILPPESGFNSTSFLLQMIVTPIVIFSSAFVLARGLKKGIEPVSAIVMPGLLVILLMLIARAVTLENAEIGIRWFTGADGNFSFSAEVIAAAMGQGIFSLSLGGTFMVVYGSYLSKNVNIPKTALITVLGDTTAGILAGFAIFPAVFALGLSPNSGPSLLFITLPTTFSKMPLGGIFGLMFFIGLSGAAFLSLIAAMEVLIAGIIDKWNIPRKRSVYIVSCAVLLLSLPTMINMEIFIPWDLTFGSGVQIAGALLSVLAVGWSMNRAEMLKNLTLNTAIWADKLLYLWLKCVIPAVIILVGFNWIFESFFDIVLFS